VKLYQKNATLFLIAIIIKRFYQNLQKLQVLIFWLELAVFNILNNSLKCSLVLCLINFTIICMKLKFIDLFAGIGGIRIAFENAGFKCVFANDFDKKCKITYDLNFPNEMVLEDISKLSTNQIPDFDVLTAGFPCQPFSLAGKRLGFQDERAKVFFDIVRILKDKKPRAFMLENVKNLQYHDKGNSLKLIYQELENIGYKVTHKVLNAMEYGNIPQNRERIYIVGFLDEDSFKKFEFPNKIPLTKTIYDCLEPDVDEKYFYNNKPLFEKIKDFITKKDTIYLWRHGCLIENKKKVCPTLTAFHNIPLILTDKGIRTLTPREYANFQGFPQDYKFPDVSDYVIYKQLGNSVVVPVVERIAKQIYKALSSS